MFFVIEACFANLDPRLHFRKFRHLRGIEEAMPDTRVAHDWDMGGSLLRFICSRSLDYILTGRATPGRD